MTLSVTASVSAKADFSSYAIPKSAASSLLAAAAAWPSMTASGQVLPCMTFYDLSRLPLLPTRAYSTLSSQ